MRSTTIRATAVEGVRSYPEPETYSEERLARHLAHVARYESACYVCRTTLVASVAWRRRAIDPDGEGVSLRFRGLAVDMTGRMVVR